MTPIVNIFLHLDIPHLSTSSPLFQLQPTSPQHYRTKTSSLFANIPRPRTSFPSLHYLINMTNAVSHTASTVKPAPPKTINPLPSKERPNSFRLLSLPERALYLIIGYMTFPPPSHPNSHHQHEQHDAKQSPLANHTPKPQCRHSFIRPAFSLAQTCTTLYTLYRNRMLRPDFFGTDDLLSPDCDPAYCFVPMFKRLRSLKITGDDPFSDTFRCEFIVSERLYTCDLSDKHPTHHMQLGPRRRLIRNESLLHANQVASFFNAAHNFREVRRLQLSECPPAFHDHIWKLIADAWSTVLSELFVEDVFMMFEESVLEQVVRMKALCSVQLMSQAVTYVTPFLNLSLLRYLDLSGCTVYDDDLEPLMASLGHLERLDISDTYVSPEIAYTLPNTLVALAAGERHVHTQPPIVDDTPNNTYENCFCFAYADEENEHVQNCETKNTGDGNPRWNTKNYAFLRPDKLPVLTELKWGHWGCYAQGIGSLSGVIPSLRSLTLSGKDYGDEVAQFLLSAARLLHLELLGCDVTDDTAFAISKMTNLTGVDISNCLRISSVGLFAMADGRAAKEGKLEGIRTIVSDEPIVPSVLRNNLLSDEVTRTDILCKFKLR